MNHIRVEIFAAFGIILQLSACSITSKISPFEPQPTTPAPIYLNPEINRSSVADPVPGPKDMKELMEFCPNMIVGNIESVARVFYYFGYDKSGQIIMSERTPGAPLALGTPQPAGLPQTELRVKIERIVYLSDRLKDNNQEKVGGYVTIRVDGIKEELIGSEAFARFPQPGQKRMFLLSSTPDGMQAICLYPNALGTLLVDGPKLTTIYKGNPEFVIAGQTYSLDEFSEAVQKTGVK